MILQQVAQPQLASSLTRAPYSAILVVTLMDIHAAAPSSRPLGSSLLHIVLVLARMYLSCSSLNFQFFKYMILFL